MVLLFPVMMNDTRMTMTTEAETALAAVLALTPEERVKVAERLLAQLEAGEQPSDPKAAEAACAREAAERSAAYDRGEMEAEPIEKLLESCRPRGRP